MISIIVPVYKAEKYIGQCIKSILSQTYTDWELLLIDDGSTDHSGAICDEYALKDKRITVYHKENGGVSSARNYGLDKANGDWITFIDADDTVSASYLTDFNVTESQKEADCLVSQSITQFYPRKNKSIDLFRNQDATLYFDTNLDDINRKGVFLNGCPVAKLFNKKVIDDNNLRFDTDISLNEDHLFVLSYLCCINKVILVSNSNYTYLYDYRIPSLTKKTHPTGESIKAANALNIVFNRIIKKYSLNIEEWRDCYTLFGPMQLFRASQGCFMECNSFEKHKRILDVYDSLIKYPYLVNSTDMYSKVFIQMLKIHNKYVTYCVLYLSALYLYILGRLKYMLKSII